MGRDHINYTKIKIKIASYPKACDDVILRINKLVHTLGGSGNAKWSQAKKNSITSSKPGKKWKIFE